MQSCRLRQVITPASHHSVFYRPDTLPAAKPTATKHWRQLGKASIALMYGDIRISYLFNEYSAPSGAMSPRPEALDPDTMHWLKVSHKQWLWLEWSPESPFWTDQHTVLPCASHWNFYAEKQHSNNILLLRQVVPLTIKIIKGTHSDNSKILL